MGGKGAGAGLIGHCYPYTTFCTLSTCLSLCTTLSQKTFKLQKLRLNIENRYNNTYALLKGYSVDFNKEINWKKKCLAAATSSGKQFLFSLYRTLMFDFAK